MKWSNNINVRYLRGFGLHCNTVNFVLIALASKKCVSKKVFLGNRNF